MEEPRPAELADLPDCLLDTIFALVGRHDGRGLPQVSCRFRRIFYSVPAVWREQQLFLTRRFQLNTLPVEHTAAFVYFTHGPARLLVRFRCLVDRVEIWCLVLLRHAHLYLMGCLWMPTLIRSLCCGVLRELARQCCSPRWVTGWMRATFTEPGVHSFMPLHAIGIRRLPHLCAGLTALQLESWYQPYDTATIVQALTSLRSLELGGREMPPGLVPSLLQLPLTKLWLDSATQLPDLQVLTELTSLQELRLTQGHPMGVWLPLLAPPPCQLPCLSAFLFENKRGTFMVPGGQVQRASFNCGSEPEPAALRGTDVDFDPETSDANSHTLSLSFSPCTPPPDSLARQLGWLLPAGVPLCRLELHMGRKSFTAHALHGCSRLAGLRTLVLHTHSLTGQGGDGAELAGLLAEAPHLTALRIVHMHLDHIDTRTDVLPHCLASYTGLRKLSLQGLHGLELPPKAPLFQTVEELCLAGNSPTTLPATLTPASAPHLRVLSLFRNESLHINNADVDALLLLPNLARLDLRRTSRMWRESLLRLAEGAPQLEMLAVKSIEEHDAELMEWAYGPYY